MIRGLALAVLMLASGCAASLREHVTPFPKGTPEKVPWTLNRELLTPANQRILFVVELVQGHPPETAALNGLVRLAGRYGERQASWVIAGTPAAPRYHWKLGWIVLDAPLDPQTSYVIVRYIGDQLQKWGLSFTQYVGGHQLYIIEINQERHRKWRHFIAERHLEMQTLVHEYGHMIGLPPADHGYYTMYPSFYDGAHCVNPDCALSKVRWRALLYGLFHTILGRHYLEDYCAQCRQAIAAAKAYWRSVV
jgi:hypothetical protein